MYIQPFQPSGALTGAAHVQLPTRMACAAAAPAAAGAHHPAAPGRGVALLEGQHPLEGARPACPSGEHDPQVSTRLALAFPASLENQINPWKRRNCQTRLASFPPMA